MEAWEQTRAQLRVLIQRNARCTTAMIQYTICLRLHDMLLRWPSAFPGRYELPAVRPDGLSPLFEGLPGKGAGEDPDPNRPMGMKHLKRLTSANQGLLNDTLWDKLCRVMPALLVNVAGGERVWGTLNRTLRLATATGCSDGSVCICSGFTRTGAFARYTSRVPNQLSS